MPGKIATQRECMRVRKDLLHRENELARISQHVARGMREMPMMKIEKDYVFTRPDGRNFCLPNLFEGKRQLIVYHFTMSHDMSKSCAHCTFMTGISSDARRLAASDTALCAVSRGSMEEINDCKERVGLEIPCYASTSPEFNCDMYTMMTGQECKGRLESGHHHHHPHELKSTGPMGKGARLSKNIMDEFMDDLLDGITGSAKDGKALAADVTDEKRSRMCKGHDGMGEQAGVSIFCKGADGTLYHKYSCSADMMMNRLALMEMTPTDIGI